MNSKMKHHLMAISAIFFTIVIISKLSHKPADEQAATTIPLSSRFIIIVSADWGLNCNPNIARAIALQEKLAAQKSASTTENTAKKPSAPLELIKENNGLIPLTNLCGNKEVCEFKASTDVLGFPVKSCLKSLAISYRCYEYDKIHYINSREGQKITINCKAPETKESES